MKKISFIIVLAIGLMACEKIESGPAIEREDVNGNTEMMDSGSMENREESSALPQLGNDAIDNPEKPETEIRKGVGEANN